MKGPWVKLWRSFLTDPTVQTLLKRYGHVTVTLLVALLTVTDDGIVVTPDDEIADLCGIDDKTYTDLIEKIIAKGIIFRNDDGNIEFKNWEKYQQCESAQRVRKFRGKSASGNVTVTLQKRECNENVTGRSKILEVEVDNIYNDKKHESDNDKNTRFSKPTIIEVRGYCLERSNHVDPDKFYDHYESVGWKVGNKPMKNWQAAVRTWERNSFDTPIQKTPAPVAPVVRERPTCKACGSTDLAPAWCRACHWDYTQDPEQWIIDNPIEVKP